MLSEKNIKNLIIFNSNSFIFQDLTPKFSVIELFVETPAAINILWNCVIWKECQEFSYFEFKLAKVYHN